MCRDSCSGLCVRYANTEDRQRTHSDGDIFGYTHFLNLETLSLLIVAFCTYFGGVQTRCMTLFSTFCFDLFLAHCHFARRLFGLYKCEFNRLLGVCIHHLVVSERSRRCQLARFLTRDLELDRELGSHKEVVEHRVAVHRQKGVGLLNKHVVGCKIRRISRLCAVRIEHAVFREQTYTIVDILASERQSLARFDLGVLLRIRFFLQPIIEVDTDLGCQTDVRLFECDLGVGLTVDLVNTHTVRLYQRRVIYYDVVFALLAVTHRQVIVYFGSQEEIELLELRTEHDRNADAQHVTALYQVVKQIAVRCAVREVRTVDGKTVSGGRIEETYIESGLKHKMQVCQTVREIYTGSAAAFELLQRVRLIKRSCAHV